MKYISYLAACILLFPLFSCKSTADTDKGKAAKTLVEGEMTGCEADSIRLFVLDGMLLRQQSSYPVTVESGNSKFSFKPRIPHQGFYYLGQKPEDARQVILGKEKKVTIIGNCSQFKQAKITDSPANDDYQKAMGQIDGYNREFNQLINEYRAAARVKGGPGLEAVVDKMKALDVKKLALIDSLKKSNPSMAAVVGARTYISFQSATGESELSGEPVYFAENFFTQTDFSNPVFNQISVLHENFKAFASNIGRLGFNTEQQQEYVQAWIDKIPSENTSAQKLALSGAALGFQRGGPENFIHFTDQYIKKFPTDNPQMVAQFNKQAGAMKSRTIGAVAPEISLPTPDGEMFSLTDLRGKVVLIDFWASWCGPCRRENPNVVRVYEKYKDKGFDILSVSLDRDKKRWIQAIEKDGMDWHHISDLKHWKSEAAQTYGVSSIPHTILLDKEGKIIASKLRGAALERKLEELLGEG